MKRFLFTILAVGLTLVGLEGACHAITKSWDYTKYRVNVYMKNGSESGVPDEDSMHEPNFIAWLLSTGTGTGNPNYELIAEGPLVDEEWPPSQVRPVRGPVSNPWDGRLRNGDVIIFGHGHEGVVQPNGTIAHYLQPTPTGKHYNLNALLQNWCPGPAEPHEGLYYNQSPGWRKHPLYPNDPTKDIPACCGEFKGDTWKQFLTRTGNSGVGQTCWIYREKDTDRDRVPDWADKCPATPAKERNLVDTKHGSEWWGCGPSQRDKDKDGIKDNVDKCPETDPGWVKLVDTNPTSEYYGCAPCEIDEDNDGYKGNGPTNCPDKCPGTPRGEEVDENGCSLRQRIERIKLRIDADDPSRRGEWHASP